jgi:hypothetical protein
MSIRQPVSAAARRAFWPSRPMASESWSSGHDDRGLAAVVVDEHLAHAGGRQRLGDEAGGLVVVGDDVDLLAAQLGDDHAHPRAARADARADGVDAVRVGDHGDLRAVARLAGDVGDLDEAVGDLGDLELEERLDEVGIAPRDDDRRALRGGRDLLDDGLDALVVLVALAVDLLGLGQQRLDALAQLDQRVAGVLLLDDARDELARRGRGTPRTSCPARPRGRAGG